MPTIPIRSFGGVVTAKDEAMLWRGPRYACPTDYARNVDATELDGITRRGGCDYITSAASGLPNYAGASGAAVTDIFEGFDGSQNRYLVARSGDCAWGHIPGTAVPMALAEAENLAPSGTHTVLGSTRFSGGQALRVSGTDTVTVTVPSCNYLDARLFSESASTVILYDDGASSYVAWASGHTVAPAVGTHTVGVKPVPRNNKSLFVLGATEYEPVWAYRDIGTSLTTFQTETDVFLWRDPLYLAPAGLAFTAYGLPTVQLQALPRADGTVLARLSIDTGNTWMEGARIPVSNTSWVVLRMTLQRGGSVFAQVGIRDDATGQVGWFESWVQNTSTTSASRFLLSAGGVKDGMAYTHFDSFSIIPDAEGATPTFDDFETTAAWTLSGNGTLTSSTQVCESWCNAYLDTVRYQTTAGWTKLAQMASGGSMGFTSHGASALFSTGTGLWSWAGGAASATPSTSGYAGRQLVSINERLFSASPDGARDVVNYSGVYSGAGAPDAAGLLPWYVLPQGTTKQVAGMAPFGGNMYVFFADQVHELSLAGTPAAEWGQATLRTPNGVVCPRTLAKTATQLIWQSEMGIRGLGVIPGVTSTEGGPDVDLSEDIEPTLRLSRQMTRGADSSAAIYRNCYWLALSLPTDNSENDIDGTPLVVMKQGSHQWTDTGKVNCIMVYRFGDLSGVNARPGAWYGPYTYRDAAGDTIDIRCLFATRPGSNYALYAGAANGHIFRLDHTASDCGKEIPMTFDVPHLSPGGPASRTRFVEAAIVATAEATQTLTVAAKTELATVPNAALTAAADETLTAVKTILSVEGAALKMRLHWSGAESPVTIHTIDVIHDKPRRQ